MAIPQSAAMEAAEQSHAGYGTVAVVGIQYCLPYPTELVVTRKLQSPTHGDYLVTDANGNTVFTVKGVLWSLRSRRIMNDALGNPILTAQRKILSCRRRQEVFKGDSAAENEQVRLFSAKLSSVVQFNTELDVFLDSNADEHTCDFKIVGDFFDRKFGIFHGQSNSLVAQEHIDALEKDNRVEVD